MSKPYIESPLTVVRGDDEIVLVQLETSPGVSLDCTGRSFKLAILSTESENLEHDHVEILTEHVRCRANSSKDVG